MTGPAPILDFRLPTFTRLAWTSRTAREVWQPKLFAAPKALAELRLEQALADEGTALVQLKPTEVPRWASRFLAHGAKLRAFGGGSLAAPSWSADPTSRGVWCMVGPERIVAQLEWGEHQSLAQALSIPACCFAASGARGTFAAPEWASQQAEGSTDWRTNHLLHRLGLAPAPWLPCAADCRQTLDWIDCHPPSKELVEILNWPMEWSALHGIAQVLTPVFRLVHDVIATAGKQSMRRGSLSTAPLETPAGATFPYRTPRRTPLALRRTFEKGLRHVADAPSVRLGTIDRVPLAVFSTTSEVPVFVEDVASAWPALTKWTPAYLEGVLGSAPARVRGPDGALVAIAFGDFLKRAIAPEESDDRYLLDFGFEFFAPQLLDDFNLPPAFASWHELLEVHRRPCLRSLYLGGVGTGSPLHFDLLRTSAWNTVIWGKKSWALCPPSSEFRLVGDEPDLFDASVRDRLARQGLDIRMCQQLRGETLFIPDGWWHQVRNLEPTLAITGNIVNSTNADAIIAMVGGVKDERLFAVGALLLEAISAAQGAATSEGVL